MTLLSWLTQLINQEKNTVLYRAILEGVGYSEALIVAYFTEEQISLAHLKSLIDNYTDEDLLEKKIRDFLAVRWRAIWGSNLDYISFTHGFLNQLCYNLAQKIVKPDEPLIQVLIPTITVTDYIIVSEDLRGLTEIQGDNATRELAFGDFLISEDGTAIIPIAEYFYAQIQAQEELFQHLYAVGNAHQPLMTEREVQLLRNCARPASESFFEEYSLRKNLMTAGGTLAQSLHSLCEGLINNGCSRTLTSAIAHDDVYIHIRIFADILKGLTKKDRESIFKLGYNGKTFETYWDYISGHLGKARVWVWHDAPPCVIDMSVWFRSLLKENISLFSSIQIHPQENKSEGSNAIMPFNDLLLAIKARIDARKSSLQAFLKTKTIKNGQDVVFLPYEAKNVLRLSNVLFTYNTVLESSELPMQNPRWDLEDFVYMSRLPDLSPLYHTLKSKNPDTLNAICNEALDRCPSFASLLVTKPYVSIHYTTFFRIIKEGHACVLRSYIQADKNINFTNAESNTALFVALQERQIEIAEMLIRAGGNLSNACIEEDGLLLHYLIKKQEMSLIKALVLRADYNINALNSKGNSAFHYAVNQEDMNCMILLRAHGANLAITNKNGESPLDVALKKKNQAIILYLIANNVPIVNLTIPLMVRVIRDELKEVDQFLKSFDTYDIKKDWEALHYAAKSKMNDTLKELIERGVDVSLPDADGNQALHLAANSATLDCVNLLLANKANPNAINNRGELPLHRAIIGYGIPCILCLTPLTSNKYAKDSSGSTPLFLALKNANQFEYFYVHKWFDLGYYPCSPALIEDLKRCPKEKLDGLLAYLVSKNAPHMASVISAGGYFEGVSYQTLSDLNLFFALQDILTHPNLLQLYNSLGFENLCYLTNTTQESLTGLRLYATVVAQRLHITQQSGLMALIAKEKVEVKDLWQALLKTRTVISPFWSYFDPLNDMPRGLRSYAGESEGVLSHSNLGSVK